MTIRMVIVTSLAGLDGTGFIGIPASTSTIRAACRRTRSPRWPSLCGTTKEDGTPHPRRATCGDWQALRRAWAIRLGGQGPSRYRKSIRLRPGRGFRSSTGDVLPKMAGAEGSIAPESGLFREQIGHIADRGTHHGAARRITCGFQHRRLRVIRQGKHRLRHLA